MTKEIKLNEEQTAFLLDVMQWWEARTMNDAERLAREVITMLNEEGNK
jgi:hypothetical protein